VPRAHDVLRRLWRRGAFGEDISGQKKRRVLAQSHNFVTIHR
jgi:hypothetical protein